MIVKSKLKLLYGNNIAQVQPKMKYLNCKILNYHNSSINLLILTKNMLIIFLNKKNCMIISIAFKVFDNKVFACIIALNVT